MWKQHKDVVTQENKEGAFLLHMQTGVYFGLDEVGKIIWSQLKNSCNTKDIYEFIASSYNIPIHQAKSDTLEFIQHLQENELIVEEL
ncbi:MAG: PqqD family protein [Bdellovibrionales bacterium]|nr:PqqD family protein [Bdellovibrionales bacterium]